MATDAEPPFPYMRWAKERLDPTDPKSLGLSGVARPASGEISGLHDPYADGPDPERAWREAVASRYGVAFDRVHSTCGSSHANLLVWMTFARGAHVAVETPAYEALLRLGEAVGATTSSFARDAARGWRIDAAALERAAKPGTRLIAVTDLHNPSGAALHPDDLDLLVAVAEARDATVLVDEVYLEMDPANRTSAVHRHPRVLSTNSLTKAHGLWDLRAGWVLGDPMRVAELDRWDDLVCPRQPLLPMAQATRYLPQADARIARLRARAAEGSALVDRWIGGRDDVRWTRPAGGITGLLLLGRAGRPLDGDLVARRLREDHGVQAVPGSFFQSPHALRVSFGIAVEHLDRSLAALGAVMDGFR